MTPHATAAAAAEFILMHYKEFVKPACAMEKNVQICFSNFARFVNTGQFSGSYSMNSEGLLITLQGLIAELGDEKLAKAAYAKCTPVGFEESPLRHGVVREVRTYNCELNAKGGWTETGGEGSIQDSNGDVVFFQRRGYDCAGIQLKAGHFCVEY